MPKRRAGRPEMSLSDRLTEHEKLLGTPDPMEDPWDPNFSFDESKWSSGTVSRRSWISKQYEAAYGTKKPWKLPGATKTRNEWVGENLKETFGATEPWVAEGVDSMKWFGFKPKDRYGKSGRSALLMDPEDIPPTVPDAARMPPQQTPEGTPDHGNPSYLDQEAHLQRTSTGDVVRSGRAGFLAGEGPTEPWADQPIEAATPAGPAPVESAPAAGVVIRGEEDSFVGSDGIVAGQSTPGGTAGGLRGGTRGNTPSGRGPPGNTPSTGVTERVVEPAAVELVEFQSSTDLTAAELAAEAHLSDMSSHDLNLAADPDDAAFGIGDVAQVDLPPDPVFNAPGQNLSRPLTTEEAAEFPEFAASEAAKQGGKMSSITGEIELGPRDADRPRQAMDESATGYYELDEPSFEDSVEPSRVEGQQVDTDLQAPTGLRGSGQFSAQGSDPIGPRQGDINAPITAADQAFLAEPTVGPVPPALDTRPWWQRAGSKFKKMFKGTPGELETPLLQQGAEFQEPAGLGGTEMMHLGDKPTALELAPELDASTIRAFDGAVESMKGRGWSDSAISSELGIGVGSGGGLWIQKATFKDWLGKQGKGLLAMPFAVPLTMWINSLSPVAGNYLSLGMVGVDLLATGDPFGALLFGATQAYAAAAESRQKVLDNDKPDKKYGTRFGYVREGDRWYPAVFNKRFKSTGLFAGDGEMTMSYGNHAVNFIDGEGNWRPGFTDGKTKDFVVQNSELNKDTTTTGVQWDSKEFANTQQVTRDWYFLSPDDASKVVKNELPWVAYDQDFSEMSPPQIEMNDWRKAMEYGQDWKWGSAVDTLGDGAHVNSYPGSRGLDRIVREAVTAGNSLGWDDDFGPMTQEEWVKSAADSKGQALHKNEMRPATDYLFDTILRDHVEALYKTQRLAAKDLGFDQLYNTQFGQSLNAYTLARPDKGGATVWSSMYMDNEKDMPVATDADELQRQLHEIELYGDRTASQRNYLAQKVQTRYWMQQITNQGGATDMMHWLYGRDAFNDNPNSNRGMMTQAVDEFNQYTADYSSLPNFDQVVRSIADPGTFIQSDELKNVVYGREDEKHLDTIAGWVAPWNNKGEGLLPTLTGALAGREYVDLMDDYRGKAYGRMTFEAKYRQELWVDQTLKIDPSDFEKIAEVPRKSYDMQELLSGLRPPSDLPFDEGTDTYVEFGKGSPGTTYNAVTNEYELTDEEKERRRHGPAPPEGQAEWVAKDPDWEKKLREELGIDEPEPEPAEPDKAEPQSEEDKYIQKMLDAAQPDADKPPAYPWDFKPDQGFWSTELPPGFYMAEGPYGQPRVFGPDNKEVPAGGPPHHAPPGTTSAMDYWIQAAQTAHEKTVEPPEEETTADPEEETVAAADPEEEERDRDAERRQVEADLAAGDVLLDDAARIARQQWLDQHPPKAPIDKEARWAEWDAWNEERAGIRTKGDIEAQELLWALEDAKDEDVPDPFANSHGFDPVPHHAHVISVPLPDSIDHEEQHFVPMSHAFHSAIAALEAGPASQPPPHHVKVV